MSITPLDIDIPELKKDIKEGVFYDMSIRDYHSFDGLSSTQFQDLDLSVAIYENRHLFKYESEAFNVGNLNHTALLEPHLLGEYIETTTKSFNTDVTKNMMEAYSNRIVVPLGSIEIAKERAYKTMLVYGDNYVKPSIKEVSFIVWDEDLKLYRKCRADMWIPNSGIVLDYKTSKETKPEAFRKKSIPNYDYDLSAAWYMDTINMAIDKFNLPYPKVTQFGWIVSPNYAPYKPFGGVAMEDVIEKGRSKYAKLVDKYISVTQQRGQDDLFKSWHTDEFIKKQLLGEING